MKVLICVDGSPVTNEGLKCAVDALRIDIEYTLLYVLEEHGIYDSYKRIFREDLERIEELFKDIDSEKEAAKKILFYPCANICASMALTCVQLYERVRLAKRYWTSCATAHTIS